MKRMYMAAATIVAVLLIGCGENNTTTIEHMQTDTEYTTIRDSGKDVIIHKLPYNQLQYNDNFFSIGKIDLYELKTEHGYYPFVILKFDCSSLSSDDIYWMMKDDAFESTVWIQNEEDAEKTRMAQYCVYDEDRIYCYYFSSNESRYNYQNAKLSASIKITQDETYEFKSSDGDMRNLNKQNTYFLFLEHEGEPAFTYMDESEMSAADRENFEKGIKSIAEKIQK